MKANFMTILYGITNCATVKKARLWLDENNIAYQFVDFKKTPPTAEQLKHWLASIPLDTLINKRGTTWRKLTPEQQAQAQNINTAIDLMREHSSVIKRPILEHNHHVLIGFDTAQYATIFQAA
jgi:transcriptional regulator, spx/mgsR family